MVTADLRLSQITHYSNPSSVSRLEIPSIAQGEATEHNLLCLLIIFNEIVVCFQCDIKT